MGLPLKDRFTILLEVYENFEVLHDLMDRKGRSKLNELLATLYSVDYRASKINMLLKYVKERFANTLFNASIYETKTFNDLKNSEIKNLKSELKNLKKDVFKALKLMEEIYSIVWRKCAKNEAKGCEAVVKVSMSIERWRDLIDEIERLEESLRSI